MSGNPYREKLETAIIESTVEGSPFVFDDWAKNEPVTQEDRGVAKIVRADFLRNLCLGALPNERWPDHRRIHPKGINVVGLAISGTLDLAGCVIKQPIRMSNCVFDEGNGIALNDARTRSFAIPGCDPWFLNVDSARIVGGFLAQGVRCSGGANFSNAYVSGRLNCSGATFKGDECGLSADGLRVDGGMFLNAVDGTGFTAKGKEAVSLRSAHIGGQLGCSGATFEGEERGLTADGLRVDGGMFLSIAGDKGFTATGKEAVRLLGAHIAGQLGCSGATFEGEECGLSADGLRVDGDMFLDVADDKDFTSTGKEAVRLLGAHISGQLGCNGATFNGQKCGLSADGLRVEGGMFLGMAGDKGFTASGQVAVRLLGAHIAGQLGCSGATFEGEGHGLTADRLRVGGDLFLAGGFVAIGEIAVSLNSSEIEGSLWLDLSLIQSTPGGIAVMLDRAEVKDRLQIEPITEPNKGWIGAVDLRNASADVLADSPDAWPKVDQGMILLDGFRYRHLLDPHRDFRLEWLRRQPDDHLNGEFRPQPWEQLAKVYRESGHPEEARGILVAKQNQFSPVLWRRIFPQLAVWWRETSRPQWRQSLRVGRATLAYLWHQFLHWTVAYGYRPLRASVYLLLIWLAGAWFFLLADSSGLMAPTQAAANAYLAKTGEMLPGYPEFQPLWYSLDVSLPVVDLHQESFWEPSASVCAGSAPEAVHPGHCASARSAGLRWLLEWWRVSQILAGWILVALAVAGLTGIVKKD